MTRTASSTLLCAQNACQQPLAGPVAYCPFCGKEQPKPVADKPQPAPAAPTAKKRTTTAPPPLPNAVTSDSAVETEQPAAGEGTEEPNEAEPSQASPPAPAAPQINTPKRRHHSPRSRAPMIIGGLLAVTAFWALFLRGDDGQGKLDTIQIETWRSAVDQCLRSNDLTCAEQNLSLLRAGAPADYWADLQQSTQDLRQRRALDDQRRENERHIAETQAKDAEQRALASQQAQAEQQALAESQAQALAAAELLVPTPPPPSPGINRPARVDRASQQRNPPRYLPGAMRDATSNSVVLDIEVDAYGDPTRVTIARSSGSRAVDRAAREAAQRWRYEPAMTEGKPVIGSLQQQVDFTPSEETRSASSQNQNTSNAGAGDADLLRKARNELNGGRYDVALALAESALQLNPSSHEARDLIQRARAERSQVMRETTID